MANRKPRNRKSGENGAGQSSVSATAIVPQAKPVTDDEKREAMERLIAADEEAKTSKTEASSKTGKYRKAFQEAMKFTGFTERALKWFMKNRKRDPKDLDAETRECNAVAKYQGMAIGGQIGLDLDGSSIASNSESARAARDEGDEATLEACEAQGKQAGTDAADFNSNPYPAGSKRAARWATGWKAGTAGNVIGAEENQGETPVVPAAATLTANTETLATA